MKGVRSLVGVSRMDRARNEEVRRRAGIENEIVEEWRSWIERDSREQLQIYIDAGNHYYYY